MSLIRVEIYKLEAGDDLGKLLTDTYLPIIPHMGSRISVEPSPSKWITGLVYLLDYKFPLHRQHFVKIGLRQIDG